MTSTTSLTCETSELPAGSGKPVVVTALSINSADPVTVEVTALSTTATVSPNSARSNEKRDLTIIISGMNTEYNDITKYSASLKNNLYHIRMKVNAHSFSNGNNILTVRYPGGYLGNYQLNVEHDNFGNLERSAAFRVGATITSVSPLSGSVAGGTPVTVSGTDFEPGKSVIYFNREPCATTGTSTELKCLSPPSPRKDASSNRYLDHNVQVAVVTDITDDVTCASASACNFKWQTAKTPEVTTA